MKNPMQLKAIIKNIAKEKNIIPQSLLEMYVLELFLNRLSKSKYKENFIIKGGFLISSLVGVESRTTMDIDATLVKHPLNRNNIDKIFNTICKIDLNDNFSFKINYSESIREEDEYEGIRIHLIGIFSTLQIPFKIDVTSGDIITPKAIKYNYKGIIEERAFQILAYNKETILAEKLETILSRGVFNTRLRDFYDIYIINDIFGKSLDYRILKSAINKTFINRGSLEILNDHIEILKSIQEDKNMNGYWLSFQKSFPYSKNIKFSDCIFSIIELLNKVNS